MTDASGPSIVVTEAFSTRHIGNWALAENAVRQLRGVFPNARITLLARDPETIGPAIGERTVEKLFPKMPHHATQVQQVLWLIPNTLWAIASTLALIFSGGNPRKYARLARLFTPRGLRRDALEAILAADLVVSIAGESINDMFLKKLPFVLYTYWLPARLGKPVMLFPQTIGPLRPWLWRKVTGRVLRRCAMAMPRDKESLQLLQSIGMPAERSPFVPDMVIGQPLIGAEEAEALLSKAGFGGRDALRIGVVPAAFQAAGGRHIQCLAGALRMFLDRHPEARVGVLIGNRRGSICQCNDYEVAEQFVKLIGNDSRVVPLMDLNPSPAETKGILAQLDLFVSCRMHMAILSTMAGTPTVALATQSKIPEYMQLCGQRDRVAMMDDGLSEKSLLKMMEDALESAAEIRQQLAISRARLEPLAAAAGAHARDVLCSRQMQETLGARALSV